MTNSPGLVFRVTFNAKAPANGRRTRRDAPRADLAAEDVALAQADDAGHAAPAARAPALRAVAPERRTTRLERMLALAHVIERAVQTGAVENYAELANRLGITRARVTQITNLVTLSPRVQERILNGSLESNERDIRVVLRSLRWSDHEAALD